MTSESWSDTQKILAIGTVLAFFVIIVLLMFFPPKADSQASGTLLTLVGTFGTLAGAVVTFYFGSSKGSSAKDDTINSVIASQSKTIEEQKNGHPTTP